MIRYYIPGTVWFVVMWLLFLSPVSKPVELLLGGIPSRSLIHGLLFAGFTHLWLGALKKQLQHEKIRRKAFLIVPIGAIILILTSELTIYLIGNSVGITLWNVLFDFLGAGLGILSFKLLYHKCY